MGSSPICTTYTLYDFEALHHVYQESDGLKSVMEIIEMTWKEPGQNKSSVSCS